MNRRALWLVGGLLALTFLGLIAWKVTRVTLTSGEGRDGAWRLEASWTPKEYCLRMFHVTGDGGACAYTLPPTLNEVTSWRVLRGNEPFTIAAGPVTSEAARVEIQPAEGPTVEAEMRKVIGLTFFYAQMPGVQALKNVVAYDDDGNELDRLTHAPYPPPSPVGGPPDDMRSSDLGQDPGFATIDDLWARVGRRYPGFAGVIVRSGRPTLLSTRRDIDVEGVRRMLMRLDVQEPTLDAPKPARYPFLQLYRWYQPFAKRVLALQGIVYTDIDEEGNVLDVGAIHPAKAEARVRRLARRSGVPEEALTITRSGPAEATGSTT